MKIKKYVIGILAGTMITSTLYTVKPVAAIDFSKNEEKYMKLCSSGNLTNSNKSTCESFNKYLKNKNKELINQLAKQKEEASSTKETLNSVQKKLTEINNDISAKETEIKYVETAIENTQKEIDKSDALIKDRMYVMQSYLNDNSIIDYIFSADNFTDFFTRIGGFNDLTDNDQDLIADMLENKKAIETQKATLDNAKKVLEQQKAQQAVIQAQYSKLLEEQNKNIAATQNAIYDYGEATESLSAAIDEFNANAYESPVTGSKPEPPANNNNSSSGSGNTSSGSNSSSSGSGSSSGNTSGGSSNSGGSSSSGSGSSSSSESVSGEQLGYNIYKVAYSKLGCRYYWGAQGPDYFDCSGLVYYCLNKAGVSVGRTTAAGYSQKWSAVSWSNSRTGDLVCFGSPAYHIGIVILNADGTRNVIHAGGGNSSTHGDNPNAKVKISSLEPGSYYYSRISTIRRVKQ